MKKLTRPEMVRDIIIDLQDFRLARKRLMNQNYEYIKKLHTIIMGKVVK